MLMISDRTTATCIVIHVEGGIEGAEYDTFAEVFENAVKQHGDVNLVVIFKGSVHYGDLEAFKDDWRFAFSEYHHARRAAYVGEQHLINAMLRIFSPITRVEDKIFSSDETDEAIAWACG